MRDLTRFKGCLIGGAVGDALGYEVEFDQAASIFHRFGPNGITEYVLHDGVAPISDDTQMTLFSATGLLLGMTRGMTRGIGGVGSSYLWHSYQDWYRTQREPYPLPKEVHFSWLVNLPDMFHWRAPGNTCLSALSQEEPGTMEHPINHSKGCGGIMRVAPIGIYFNDRNETDIRRVDTLGAEAAALTHGHELGWLPAAMQVHILHRISEQGASIAEAVEDAMKTLPVIFPNTKHMGCLLDLVRKAAELAGQNISDLNAIRQLGQGWVAEETLAIAVYCALRYPDDFEKGVIAAVNHDGDSDSTGAVAGNILGASLGYDAIPRKFLDHLELRDVILEIAEDLHHDCQIDEDDLSDPLWISKYVTMSYDGHR